MMICDMRYEKIERFKNFINDFLIQYIHIIIDM